jgi:hypothetical protein
MPNRGQNPGEQTRDQRNQNLQNPGTFSEDDDEAQDADITQAGGMEDEQSGQGRQAQGRQDRRRAPEENIEQIEDEEDEGEDEDESDDIGQRP